MTVEVSHTDPVHGSRLWLMLPSIKGSQAAIELGWGGPLAGGPRTQTMALGGIFFLKFLIP